MDFKNPTKLFRFIRKQLRQLDLGGQDPKREGNHWGKSHILVCFPLEHLLIQSMGHRDQKKAAVLELGRHTYVYTYIVRPMQWGQDGAWFWNLQEISPKGVHQIPRCKCMGARSQETRRKRVAKRLENLNRNVVILIVLSNKN